MQLVVIVRHHFRCRARRLVQVYKTFPYFFHSFYVWLLPLPGFSVFLHLQPHFFSSFALVFLVLGSWWRGILELSSCSKPQKTDRFETQLSFEVGFCSFLSCSIQSLFWSFLVLWQSFGPWFGSLSLSGCKYSPVRLDGSNSLDSTLSKTNSSEQKSE